MVLAAKFRIQHTNLMKNKFSLPLLLTGLSLIVACSGPNIDAVAASDKRKAKPSTDLSLEERGAKIYKRCRACHTLDENGRNKAGPNLWNIYGRQAGSKSGYAYSKAMKASGVIWDKTTMDAYLKRPRDYIPKTKMTFIGLKNQIDRDAVQAYLLLETTPGTPNSAGENSSNETKLENLEPSEKE